MARKTPTARGLRRIRAREDASLHHDIDRLARLAEGGGWDHPIEVVSAAQVDVRAQAMPCPHCDEAQRLLETCRDLRGRTPPVARLLRGTCVGAMRLLPIAAPLQS
jgi:hypothetical protein